MEEVVEKVVPMAAVEEWGVGEKATAVKMAVLAARVVALESGSWPAMVRQRSAVVGCPRWPGMARQHCYALLVT